jgi:hypothetical protein
MGRTKQKQKCAPLFLNYLFGLFIENKTKPEQNDRLPFSQK